MSEWIKDHFSQVAKMVDERVLAERDALRVEVKTLEQRFRRITFTTNDDGDLVLISEQDEDGQILRVMWERKERLRKGKDDERNDFSGGTGDRISHRLLSVDVSLDHRLGTPQLDR